MKIKQLFFLALLITTGATAQTLAVNTNDPATGTRVLITKNHRGSEITADDSVVKHGLAFFSAGYQSTLVQGKPVETYFIDLDMFHNDNKMGCIKQSENNVTLILEDGSEIKCFQMSETDCNDHAFKAAFALTTKEGTTAQMEENFKKLQAFSIKRIKVKTSESLLDYKIGSYPSDYIRAHFALIAKSLKNPVK